VTKGDRVEYKPPRTPEMSHIHAAQESCYSIRWE